MLVVRSDSVHHLTMPEIIHNIDLSSVPHRPGQSTDLEAKRQRAWARLSDEEKEWVIGAWDLTGMIPSAPPFREMRSAGDRVLYVLVGTEESLTPLELCYLMIARWFRNIDPATARAKMAQLVSQGYARYTGIGRTMATEAGLEALEELKSRRPSRSDDDDDNRRSDHRQTTSRTRIVDRGESPNSNFGNRGAPTGRFRSEIPDDGGRPKRRESSREERESVDDYRGRDSMIREGIHEITAHARMIAEAVVVVIAEAIHVARVETTETEDLAIEVEAQDVVESITTVRVLDFVLRFKEPDRCHED